MTAISRIAACLSLVALAACNTTPSPTVAATGPVATTALVGNTYAFKTNAGLVGTIGYRPDGTIFVTSPGAQQSGTWVVKGEQMCITLPSAPNSSERCSTIRADGQGGFVDDKGNMLQPV